MAIVSLKYTKYIKKVYDSQAQNAYIF